MLLRYKKRTLVSICLSWRFNFFFNLNILFVVRFRQGKKFAPKIYELIKIN